jgi:hypothetical protein
MIPIKPMTPTTMPMISMRFEEPPLLEAVTVVLVAGVAVGTGVGVGVGGGAVL